MTYGFAVLDPSMSNHIKQLQEFYPGLWQDMISIVKHLYGNAKRGIPSKPIRRVNRDWLNYCVANSAELTRIQEKKGCPSKNKGALPPT